MRLRRALAASRRPLKSLRRRARRGLAVRALAGPALDGVRSRAVFDDVDPAEAVERVVSFAPEEPVTGTPDRSKRPNARGLAVLVAADARNAKASGRVRGAGLYTLMQPPREATVRGRSDASRLPSRPS